MTTASEIIAKGNDANIFAITPSDDVALVTPPDMIWVGVAADLVVKNNNGDTITFPSALGWMFTPGITHVLTATVATGLVGVASRGIR